LKTGIDSVGKEVKTLIDQRQNAGQHRVIWNGTGKNNEEVSSGTYYYQLQTEKIAQTKKQS
jgi:flagellar hook assembly protein FlgD